MVMSHVMSEYIPACLSQDSPEAVGNVIICIVDANFFFNCFIVPLHNYNQLQSHSKHSSIHAFIPCSAGTCKIMYTHTRTVYLPCIYVFLMIHWIFLNNILSPLGMLACDDRHFSDNIHILFEMTHIPH